MAGNARSCTDKLAARLNHLFATVHPRDRGPYSNDEVARAIRERGGDISKAYIAYLRNGKRSNPTMHHIVALAGFFGVKPAYFFDDEVAEEVDSTLVRMASLREAGLQVSDWEALRDSGVTRIAARANGLSPKGLLAAVQILNQLRALEGLPLEENTDDV
ncbi:helix-turn-helix domain-containing protein [Saccharothrix sp. ST-888]|uniref:helix-turn-helix domain-containing protein n=1 Tax=Saccharothrix sp. ST-888 TaxID=1427391 RepID=UPI0005EC3707|nr:helix-turn-helix transcriptional regulator [Saccharothrix sp. ST-888]KJK56559.1 XRE family transcriptional regulator [Saccharothrix sp. ST-888]